MISKKEYYATQFFLLCSSFSPCLPIPEALTQLKDRILAICFYEHSLSNDANEQTFPVKVGRDGRAVLSCNAMQMTTTVSSQMVGLSTSDRRDEEGGQENEADAG